MSDAIRFLVERGVPDEACMPYQSADGENIPCSAACGDAPERMVGTLSLGDISDELIRLDKEL